MGFGFGAVLANTSLDEDFQNWYQRDVRGSSTDSFSSFWKQFGEGHVFIPAFACLGLTGTLCQDRPILTVVGDFGNRVTRAYLVGAPPVLLMQFMLGASRPKEHPHASQWRPFEDVNSVSGHAFVGAVPFLTAAYMCDTRLAKCALLACSTFTAWSRVNDDSHYLSQACLGWWMAYLACRSVDYTEREHECTHLAPVALPGALGLGLFIER